MLSLFVVILLISVSFIPSFSQEMNGTKTEHDGNNSFDIPNWVALVLEISIAIPFAIYLFRKQQKISQQLEKVIFHEAEFRKHRRDFGIITIESNLKGLKESLKDLISEINSYEEQNPPEKNIEPLNKIWESHKKSILYYTDSLEKTVIMLGDVLDTIESQQVLEACRKATTPIDMPLKEAFLLQFDSAMDKTTRILEYMTKKQNRQSKIDS